MNTSHYAFQQALRPLWEKAVTLYQAGNRASATFFDAGDRAFLAAIGHTAQEVYDFAEDFARYGEPDFETFLLIAAQRRDYFLNVLGGRAGEKTVNTENLPPKTARVRGIEWLPRLIAKARAKLRGEMADDLMYGCGGDRAFFRAHDIHPAEFLAVVARHFDDDAAIVDFVAARSKSAAQK